MPIERSREWNTARAFGAVVQSKLLPGKNSDRSEVVSQATTHLIVGRPGTNKHRQAQKIKGLKVVSPMWLWACAEQWEWVSKALFALKPPPENTTTKETVKKVDDSGHTDSSVEHMETEAHVTSGSGVGVAMPACSCLYQCDADGRWQLLAQEPSLLCL